MMRLSKSCRGIQKCLKKTDFRQTLSLFQMEKRASPLFQAFFPLPLGFFLNQAAVFRQSQEGGLTPSFLFVKHRTQLANTKQSNKSGAAKKIRNGAFWPALSPSRGLPRAQ